MKKTKIIVLFFACVLISFSCRYEISTPVEPEPNPAPIGCPEMYDARSKPYVNPYMGTLQTGSFIPLTHVYPEKYSYWMPCFNPNNDYQICYCRRENGVQDLTTMDLFVYDFCTGITQKIGDNAMGDPNWSVKNWILFTRRDGNIWKVKPNGDSLTKLTNDADSFAGIWSPNGELFVASASTKVVDEYGIIKYTITNCGAPLGWYDNTHLMNVFAQSNRITKIDVTTNRIQDYGSTNGYGIGKFHKKTNEFLAGTDTVINGERLTKRLTYNATSNTVTYLHRDYIFSSFLMASGELNSNRIVLQQNLRDPMTGSPTLINFRSHIAIMNLDGSNLRQVLLPE